MERKLLIIFFVFLTISMRISCDDETDVDETSKESDIYYILPLNINDEARKTNKDITAAPEATTAKSKKRNKNKKRKNTALNEAVQTAALQGLNAMIDLYEKKEPEMLEKGEFLEANHPAARLSLFSSSMTNDTYSDAKAAYASLFAAKKLQESINYDFTGLGRQTSEKKRVSLKRTALEGLCPPREPPQCVAATRRYRTHDGTCNNNRKPRWGSAHLPFHRFLPPDYSDGLEEVRRSILGGALPSARFVSLVVHGYRDEESQVTMLLPQWGQLIDHDLTATLQPRSINGSVPKCCNAQEQHPSCLPMKVPRDDPFLASLGVRCLEFLRSAPAQRRDCFLSWREQTNQVTSYLDASCVYSSNPRTADSARILRDGLLLFGRGPPREDPCLHGGFGHQCIRAGDARAGEQPGLLALHTVFVAEHNRITLELADLNPHWSDEKLYQETRRIIGAIFQHITYREFLPLVLGREVCRLFDLELKTSGYYDGYDQSINPTIANAFSAAAFRFGHSIIQGSILRADASFRFLNNNVTLHDENSIGDIGGSGSLHRIIRGLAEQRTLKRDEFMSPELTNHLFQSSPFPFGMDLAAINIQRGRDHGIPSYVAWRVPCGLSPIESWEDLDNIVGPRSAERIRRAYDAVEDIDLFVGGISERPVRGGLVGPTFACIIAQQFSNLRKGDRFWYENPSFESSFTPAQLNSIRQTSLSQILCRSLGSSSFFQPHAFLPPEFLGNERIRCGTDVLTPINLNPWAERDPFHKEADLPTANFVEPNVQLFLAEHDSPFSTTTNPIDNLILVPTISPKPGLSNNIDFDEIAPKPSTTKRPKPSTSFNNNLDFISETTSRPKRKRTTTTTKRPISIVNNKVDFNAKAKTTKRPIDNPFHKMGRESNTTKRSTDGFLRKRISVKHDKLQHRSDTVLDLTDIEMQPKQFRNQDNATKYLDNKAVTVKFENGTEELEGRVGHNFYSQSVIDDYRPIVTRPNDYYPPYPPLTSSTRRPVSFENNRPNFYNRLESTTRSSPISNKLSGPFSYDTPSRPVTSQSNYDRPSVNYDTHTRPLTPQVNYDNMAIPLYISPNRPKPQSNLNYQNLYKRYPTTRKPELSTFLIVETTRRTTPNYFIEPTTKRPFYQSKFPSSVYISSVSNANNFLSSVNKFSSFPKRPTPPPLNNDYDDNFDGYLRPENNDFYMPFVNKNHHSYYDYTKYNYKPETSTQGVKYYFIKNKLHKYQYGKENDDETVTDDMPSKRYAEMYDEHLKDVAKDDYVTLTNATDVQVKRKLTVTNRKISIEERSKNKIFADTLLVPFRLLTRPERPDNWINVDSKDTRKLPEVPALTQDENFARELPKPFGSKIFNEE